MLTLGDATNGFNLLCRLNMLWVVRHRWPKGARFAFNMYRHQANLLLRGPVGSEPEILLSREGVTQGCPLGMILYGIALLPLAEDLCQHSPDVVQPWYVDDNAFYARALVLAKLSKRLCEIAPLWATFRSRISSGASVPGGRRRR